MLGIFLDTETNGLNVFKHRVIEIALQIVDLLTGEIRETFHTVVSVSDEEWKRSDKESLCINGFTWEEVRKGSDPREVKKAIVNLFAAQHIQRGQAVFLCQNPSFDRAFFTQIIDVETQEALLWPYHWLDLASMFWTKAMEKAARHLGPFPWETGLSKDNIASVYKIPPELKPHRALNGVLHLSLCYETLIGFPHKRSST